MSNKLMQDRAAREIARTVFDRPIVLRAGAGTGKTAALVARVTAWLVGPGWEKSAEALGKEAADSRIAGRALRRVVAITFTEAAAAEMAERIATALHALSTGCAVTGVALDELPEESRDRARVLLPAVDQLEVRTIHAWCRNILVEYPLEAALHPQFEVDAAGEMTAQIVRKEVEANLTEMLQDERSQLVLGLFERGVTPTDIESAVRTLVDEAIEPERLSMSGFTQAKLDATWLGLRNGITDVLDSIGSRLEGVRAPNGQSLLAGLSGLRAALEPNASVEEVNAAIEGFVPQRLRSHLRKAWVSGKGGKGEAAALEDIEVRLRGVARTVYNCMECVVGLDQEGYRLAQMVLQPIVVSVQKRMRTKGVLGFTGLLVRAARVLKNQSVARRVRDRIDQLLVDEFQDTDPLQCDIIRALALQGERGSRPGLFLVGDPKQSIYGWRSADLRAYEGFVREVLAEGGQEHGLVQNFRSTTKILDEVDRCMTGLLVADPGVQPAHESLIAARGEGTSDTSVEAWVSWDWAGQEPLVSTSAEVARRIEARALADDLRRLHDSGVCLSEIGVLFRSTTHLQIYQWALRDAGVPYEVTRDRNYFRRREVVECAAMVRAILDPVDTLALVSFLRSAMVNLPDAALLPLWRVGFPKEWSRLSLETVEGCIASIRGASKDCEELEAHVAQLGQLSGWAEHLAAVVERVARLRDLLRSTPFDLWIEQVRTLMVPDVVNSVAYQGVYRAANIERFFRMLTERMEASAGDIHTVLRVLRDAVAHQREAEESRPNTAGPAVQLMTIHKSKGLAFTHTYMVDLHHRFRPSSTRTGTYIAGAGFTQLMGLWTPGFEQVWTRQQNVERAERSRLLYVGMTRARDRLVLMGAWPERLAGHEQARVGLDLLGSRQPELPDALGIAQGLSGDSVSVTNSGVRWVFPGRTASSSERLKSTSAEAAVVSIRPLSNAQRQWADTRSLKPWSRGPSSAAPEFEGSSTGGLLRADALQVGTAVHMLMERIADGDGAPPERILDECLHSASMDGGISKKGYSRAHLLLEKLQQGSLLTFLRSVEVLGTEVPILIEGGTEGPVGAWVGSIDLLYRCPATNEIVVVDHKTDRVDGQAPSEVAQHHAAQGQIYCAAVQRALGIERQPRFEVWLIEADARVVVNTSAGDLTPVSPAAAD